MILGTRRTRSVLASILAVSFLLAACQVPDTAPFVAGTAQLKQAVAAAGFAVEEELRRSLSDGQRADLLKESWTARNRSMTSLLRHAQSLDAIAAAGNSGAEAAGRIADSVTGLAEAAGVAIPLSPEAFAVATDVARFLYGQIARVRAADELAEALDAAQPAIERIAELMRRDLADLAVVNEAVAGLGATALVLDANDLLADRKELRKNLSKSKLDTPEQRAEYEKVLALLSAVEERCKVHEDALAAIENRMGEVRSLIDATGRALDAWAAAHAELAIAARRNQTVDNRLLIDAALEIRGLVTRIREP